MISILKNLKIKVMSLGIVLAGMISAGIFMQSCNSEMESDKLTNISDSKFALFEKEFAYSLSSNLIDFVGSDCDFAMGSGHCWNEIM